MPAIFVSPLLLTIEFEYLGMMLGFLLCCLIPVKRDMHADSLTQPKNTSLDEGVSPEIARPKPAKAGAKRA